MTNGELFIAENPNIEIKLNGSCVWIYFDDVNHYTMPISWWEQEIGLFDKIRDEIETARFIDKDTKLCKNANASGLEVAMQIIDKYKGEGNEK